MKIKKIGAICNADGRYYLMDQKDDAGEIMYQWLGVVDFPAPSTLPPVEDAPPEETGREKDIEWAALMLKTLRNYCETMAAVKGGQTVPWAERADALAVAIAALRK